MKHPRPVRSYLIRSGLAFVLAVFVLAVSPVASAQPLAGPIGLSSQWGSGWLDLATPTDFRKGDRLRLKIGGTADKIVVRLLPKGNSPDSPVGVIGGAITVPPNRIVEVSLKSDKKGIIQISVHGGPNPWGRYPLGRGNGAAALKVAELIRKN